MAALNSAIMSCWLSSAVHKQESQTEMALRLTDHGLPEAGGPWVLRDGKVTLETHFTVEGRQDFTGLRPVTREERTLEENFEEDLGIAKEDVAFRLNNDGQVKKMLTKCQQSNQRVFLE